ncbi:hypothetical protein BSKO_08560 [Bryopsis sp. KO-2023]|nr:hypothetical protein BSKO_08560 [Bryopsis sp. KO-2023]
MESLANVAQSLAAPGKGILASDESTGTVGKRLEKVGLENTEEVRRAYREILYSSDIGHSVSGAILFKETLFQSTSDGVPFVDMLKKQKVLVGIKVDEGLVKLKDSEETETRGLDTLADRCGEYTKQGAVFAKWRGVLKIGDGMPSEAAIEKNAAQLAEYAAICQAKELVPIVEPEVLIDGSHGIAKFCDVHERVLSTCVSHMWKQGVCLEGCLLKPQMMINGTEFEGPRASKGEVAECTLRVMRRCIPPALPGIMFLSGGQTESEATVNLNEINRVARLGGGAPWSLSFSFGRALQASVLKIWSNDQSRVEDAKSMASALAYVNGLASRGHYAGSHPSITSQESLHETHRGWRTDVRSN